MKSIIEFINVNIYESYMKFEIEDVADAINNVCSGGDDWLCGPGQGVGSFEDAVENTGSLYDVLAYHNQFDKIADYFDCNKDEIDEFIYNNEDKIMKEMGFK